MRGARGPAQAPRGLGWGSESPSGGAGHGAAPCAGCRRATAPEALSEILAESGQTKRAWARELGISPQALDRRLNGSRDPKVSTLCQMAGSLGYKVAVVPEASEIEGYEIEGYEAGSCEVGDDAAGEAGSCGVRAARAAGGG